MAIAGDILFILILADKLKSNVVAGDVVKSVEKDHIKDLRVLPVKVSVDAKIAVGK